MASFIGQPSGMRVLLDLFGIGVSGGLYVVPLFAVIQQRTRATHLARVIAGMNILNALLMVCSAITGIIIVGLLEISIPGFFLILAIANLLVAWKIYSTIAECMIRFMIWMLTKVMYRVERNSLGQIPQDGPCVLVCNH